MHRLTRNRVQELAAHTGSHCSSIYLPTHRAGPEVRQDPIRLKNLLSEARQALEVRGVDDAAARSLLAPLETLVEDREFWRNQGDGLALFASPDEHWIFRLPIAVQRLVVVGKRYHLKPLIPMLVHNGRFYLLALSTKRVRLFEATRFTMREMDIEDVPARLGDAVGYDWEQRSLQFHSSTPSGRGPRSAEFHGHGVGQDSKNGEVARFLQLVDRGVSQLIGDPAAPLVLAAVDEIVGEYRKHSRYPALTEDAVPGNPDEVDEDRLHDAGWRVVEPHFERRRTAAAERIRSLLGTGKAVQQLQEVVVAAADGRVEDLFVAEGVQRWGQLDREQRSVTVHGNPEPADEDLLNRAAVEAITHDGTVFVVPHDAVPSDGSPVAATLRY